MHATLTDPCAYTTGLRASCMRLPRQSLFFNSILPAFDQVLPLGEYTSIPLVWTETAPGFGWEYVKVRAFGWRRAMSGWPSAPRTSRAVDKASLSVGDSILTAAIKVLSAGLPVRGSMTWP